MSRSRSTVSLVCGLMCLASFPATHVHAETLPSVPSSCFSYHFENVQEDARGFHASALHASYEGSKSTLTTGEINATSPEGNTSSQELQRLNASAAFAALTAFQGQASNTCQLNTSSFHGTLNTRWGNVTLAHNQHRLTIRALTLNTSERNKNTNVSFSASGVKDTTSSLIPSEVSASLIVEGHSATPLITINSLHAVNGTNALDGHGSVQTAANPLASSADLHISLTNVDALLNDVRQTAPARVTTALTIARLMGRANGSATEWDVGLHNGVATVNNVPIPLNLH
ncbi:DUF2125 domain-containing protein [Neokomagataea tanensis]|uniref:DUF2125 domain-containing protein n=1 Tax=Neokomagataea tanensis TaxID=661191 RepID=A0A4Y6V1M9_9PROT|nr:MULTISPECIES: DUF2125 domain-containing protein [Neokomagataea]QDH23962.1 DUF2125 domain-containing protein [Neokomagataea tanensis]